MSRLRSQPDLFRERDRQGSGSGSIVIREQPEPDEDPRVRAFRNLVRAADRFDIPAMKTSQRELRRLGWSCCRTAAHPGD